MRKYWKNKETRDLIFITVSIIMAILICVTRVKSANMFGVVISVTLLALLCTGLGYLYCRYESDIFSFLESKDAEKGTPNEKTKPKIKVSLFKSGSVSKTNDKDNV